MGGDHRRVTDAERMHRRINTLLGKVALVVLLGAVVGYFFHQSVAADISRSETLTFDEYAAGYAEYREGLRQDDWPLLGHMAVIAGMFGFVFAAYELLGAMLGRLVGGTLGRVAGPVDDAPAESSSLLDSARFHRLLARLALVGAVVVVGVIFMGVVRYSRGYVVPRDTDVFTAVEGTWAWIGADSACATSLHTISFSPARDSMFIVSSEPFEGIDGAGDSTTVYVIQEHTRSRIRGAIPGETRLTEGGEPVVWDLVLRSPHRYVWRRTDWLPWGFSNEIERCREESMPVEGP